MSFISSSGLDSLLPQAHRAFGAIPYAFYILLPLSILFEWLLNAYRSRPRPLPGFPLVEPDGDNSRSGRTFSKHARQLLLKGVQQYPERPFQVMTSNGPRIVLPNKFADEIKERPELEFFNNFGLPYRGFEAHKDSFEGKDGILPRTVRTKLTQRLGLITGDMAEEASEALQEVFGDDPEWHVSAIKSDVQDIAARISSRVFLGRELARNGEWLHIAKAHTFQIYRAVLQINQIPKPLRWPLQWFLTNLKALRQQVRDAERVIAPETQKRAQMMEEAKLSGEKGPKSMDALSWILEVGEGKKFNPAHVQLALSIVSINTAGEVMAQAVMDLCQYPDLVTDLRDEIIRVVKENGWQKSTFYQLKLMDSFLMESQRVHALNWYRMKQHVRRTVTLSDGTVLPAGATVSVAANTSADPAYFPEPEKFIPDRFLKRREEPGQESNWQFVSLHPSLMTFGYGQHACPGRFFAAAEIKTFLCFLILRYDLRFLKGEGRPKDGNIEGVVYVLPTAKIEMRRRKEEIRLEDV
ncbi:cytochrome P450 [Colletotrichum truncatum]|uniref:Cytochrome P450 n=1 Tax=Colletotrichum truncatum TaxID=5467 RepID=A0ACC3ZI85_COLTU|nr:cytochrome P450 [Colletotrichum truncatum]KAF6785624.1 cytochrome P450 [Colletotrichum truncatum]